MAGKQVEFPPEQNHSKSFEYGLLIASVLCIIFVVICIQTVGGGGL
jgi:hypothetical protein